MTVKFSEQSSERVTCHTSNPPNLLMLKDGGSQYETDLFTNREIKFPKYNFSAFTHLTNQKVNSSGKHTPFIHAWDDKNITFMKSEGIMKNAENHPCGFLRPHNCILQLRHWTASSASASYNTLLLPNTVGF